MISFIVHGGAWDIPDATLDDNRNGVFKALSIGWEILAHGGTAVDAVEKAIRYLEDDPTFDAGTGSFVVFNTPQMVRVFRTSEMNSDVIEV